MVRILGVKPFRVQAFYDTVDLVARRKLRWTRVGPGLWAAQLNRSRVVHVKRMESGRWWILPVGTILGGGPYSTLYGAKKAASQLRSNRKAFRRRLQVLI